jgi:DNA repair protein RecO (recombination protein O)
MAAEKTLALVLQATPFGETSCVVNLLTRDLGKVRALAKGAWRPKGPFDGGLDLLSTCEVIVLRRVSGGLDLLTEACLLSRFRIGTSLPAFQAAVCLSELTDAVTADADPHPELFDAAVARIHALSAHRGPDEAVETERFRGELAVLRLTGHGPALERCAACLGEVSGPRVPFGMLDGGVLCPGCRRGKRLVASVSAATRGLLQRLAAVPPGTDVAPEPRLHGEARAILDSYLAHLLGRRLRAGQWLHRPSSVKP